MSPPRKRPERTEVGLGPKDREKRSTEAPSDRAKSRRRKGEPTRPVRSPMVSPLAAPPPASLYSSQPPGAGSYREHKRDSVEIVTNRPRARTTGRFGVTKEIVASSHRPDPRRDDDDREVLSPQHPTPQMQRAPRMNARDDVSPPQHPTPQMQRAPRAGMRTEVGIGPKKARAIAERTTERISGAPPERPSAQRTAIGIGPDAVTAEHVTPRERPSAERTAIGIGPDAVTAEHVTPRERPSAERTAIGAAPDPAVTGAQIERLIDRLADPDEATRRAAGEELGKLTGVHFGFAAEASKRERDTAQRRYRDWWKAKGKDRFR